MSVETETGSARLARAQPHRKKRLGFLRPRQPLPGRIAGIVSVAGVAGFFLFWAAAATSGLVPTFFLPTPVAVVSRLTVMLGHDGYVLDVLASTGRVLGGFGLAAALAVPLGLLIGNIAVVRSLLDPLFGAARYLPATAFIPLLIIWLGIDEPQKIAVIFLGTFFPLVLMVADVSAAVSRDLVNSAYTLGASPGQVLLHVLLPGALPAIVGQLRITVGIAWTYVIVAEIVGAERGIGIAILQSQRFLLTDAVIAGILTVGLLGVATDMAFRIAHRRLFPYAR